MPGPGLKLSFKGFTVAGKAMARQIHLTLFIVHLFSELNEYLLSRDSKLMNYVGC